MCQRHYQRIYAANKYAEVKRGRSASTLEPPRPVCVLPGCGDRAHGKGFCARHYRAAFHSKRAVENREVFREAVRRGVSPEVLAAELVGEEV